jgi:MFS superfamily sulfate permease-like transporter
MAAGQARRLKHASWPARLAPGLATLARYDRRWLSKDLLAGVSVAAIALPVGLAYSDLAGVPAIIGIYSAIFPLLAYALFGSSRQLIVGPDAATCLLVAASLAPLAGGDPQRYLAMLPIFTLMAGVLYLIAGAARLGFIATFLSQPILTGYLNGIALIILVGPAPEADGLLERGQRVRAAAAGGGRAGGLEPSADRNARPRSPGRALDSQPRRSGRAGRARRRGRRHRGGRNL